MPVLRVCGQGRGGQDDRAGEAVHRRQGQQVLNGAWNYKSDQAIRVKSESMSYRKLRSASHFSLKLNQGKTISRSRLFKD